MTNKDFQIKDLQNWEVRTTQRGQNWKEKTKYTHMCAGITVQGDNLMKMQLVSKG